MTADPAMASPANERPGEPDAGTGVPAPPSTGLLDVLPQLPDVDAALAVIPAEVFAPLANLDAALAQATARLEDVEAQIAAAAQDGFEQGYARGLDEARRELAANLVTVDQSVQAFFRDAEPTVTELAFDIARRVIGAFEPVDVLRQIASRALREHAGRGQLAIVVAPDCESDIQAALAQLRASDRGTSLPPVRVDARLAAGRIMLVSEFGAVDLDAASQLASLRTAFVDHGRSGQAAA